MNADLARAASDTLSQISRHKAAADPVAQELLEVIEDRLFDSEFSAKSLALPEPVYRTLGLFRAATGLNPHDYVSLARTLIAARLLCETGIDQQRIAELTGLKEKNSLRNYCRNLFGCNPGKIRSEARRALSAGRKPFPTVEDWDRVRRGESMKSAERSERLHQLARELGRPRPAATPKIILRSSEPVLGFQVGNLFRFGREKRLRLLRKGVCRGSGEVFEALSRRSREEGRRDRQRGLELAEVALAVVEGSLEQLGPRKADYLALGWARLGNARRLASDLEGAELAILEAESWAKEALEVERVQAELLLFKGSLRLFQRRFDQALAAYGDAIALSQAAGEKLVLIDALFQRGTVHFYLGEPAEALPDLEMADQLLPPEDRRRRLVSLHNRLHASVLGDDQEQVRLLLPRARRLSEEVGDRPSFLQTQWLEGMLLREDGDFEGAESLLKEARAGFIQLHDPGMTAVCSLELALLYDERGDRAVEVRRYSSDALPALESLSLPEATGTITLLRQSIRDHSVHRSVLNSARRRLLAPASP